MLPPAERTISGQRIYTERHRLALRLERTMVGAGCSGPQRRTVMHGAHAGDADAALRVVVERFVALDELRRQVERVIERATDQQEPTPNARTGVRIGAAAQILGVTPGALRHWQLEGLIAPGRDSTNGYRIFDQQHLNRAALIAHLVGLGYGMATLRTAMHCLDEDGSATRQTIDILLAPVRAQVRACAEATSLLWRYLEEVA